MSSNSTYFIDHTLGEDFVQSLIKTELWKPGTRTTLDHEEIKTALQIVPRTILALLIKELSPMEIGEAKEFELPVPGGGTISVNKLERDVYSGNIRKSSKILVDFQYRSIPGVALICMSCFELYSTDEIEKESAVSDDISSKVQKLIDERLALHDLIHKVVDKKIEQKEAIKHLVLQKLTESLEPTKPPIKVLPIIEKPIHLPELKLPPKKSSKFRDFMERKPKEFSVEMEKSESVSCPDCGQSIFNGKTLNPCICYGNSGKIQLKKTEHGIKVKFGKNWDIDSIEMLLDVLRMKNEKR